MFDEHLLGRDFVSPALFELMNQSCEVERKHSTDPFAQLLPNFHLNASSHNCWSELELHPMGTRCINSPTILADDDHLHQQNSILSFGGNGCNYPSLSSLTSSSSTSSSMLSFHHLENCRTNGTRLLPSVLDPNPDINSVELLKDDLIMEEQMRWLYSGTTNSMDADKLRIRENDDELLGATLKRPCMAIDDQVQVSKKQCTSSSINKISRQSSVCKDPQSIAAKNRRERISERLKVLQELVPNGTKVDLVTMLEKATSYVKFLQLQIKVLANDEFWQENGGKMPDIGEMKDAIDAILSSHNESKSTSTTLLMERSKH